MIELISFKAEWINEADQTNTLKVCRCPSKFLSLELLEACVEQGISLVELFPPSASLVGVGRHPTMDLDFRMFV